MHIPRNLPVRAPLGYAGHSHLSHPVLSRRRFLGTTAGAAGAALTAGLWLPVVANDAAPRPIPGGIQPFGPGTEVFHLFLPGPGVEPSSITDFRGTIGVAAVQGKGTSSDGRSWLYDTDLRFMRGVFIGKDGEEHQGTFGFV